jgi:hypothetical protein
VQLHRDPLIDTDGANTLYIAWPCTEREPMQDVANLLIRGLFARLGGDSRIRDTRDAVRCRWSARQSSEEREKPKGAT